MDERKTFFDYIAQIFIIFGCTVLILTVFCRLFGQEAAPYSSIFRLGDKGLACGTMLQFLLVSAVITGLRFLFFSDAVFKRLSVLLRTLCMVLSVIAVIAVCCCLFSWFPVNMWKPWCMFFICFFVCFLASALLSALKVKAENKVLETALKKIQEEQDE